jgi:hypothetical protein
MEQVHVRDASATITINSWYDESPPELLKIADAQRDLLPLALHELGHALGIGPSLNAEADLQNDHPDRLHSPGGGFGSC